MRTVAEKMGLRDGMRAYLAGADETLLEAMKLPRLDRSPKLVGSFDYLHVFVTTQEDLAKAFASMRPHMAKRGSLWVSWLKGTPKGANLNLQSVIRIGYDHGLVESKTLAVDALWSAIKFTHPVPGRVYQNSFGVLKDPGARS
jgi:hypothetical protein